MPAGNSGKGVVARESWQGSRGRGVVAGDIPPVTPGLPEVIVFIGWDTLGQLGDDPVSQTVIAQAARN